MGHKFSFCKDCEPPLDCDVCDKLASLREPGYMTLWMWMERRKL